MRPLRAATILPRVLGAPIAAVLLAVACHGARPPSAAAPERVEPAERGTPAAARAVSPDDRLAIYAVIVRDFFRPTGNQARWIDPRPLGDRRDVRADSLAPDDLAWADAIRAAVGLDRVCVLDTDADDDGCRGRRGSLLRFSPPYAIDDATARVFVALVPVFRPGESTSTRFEMAFTMELRGRAWHIAGKRSLRTP